MPEQGRILDAVDWLDEGGRGWWIGLGLLLPGFLLDLDALFWPGVVLVLWMVAGVLVGHA